MVGCEPVVLPGWKSKRAENQIKSEEALLLPRNSSICFLIFTKPQLLKSDDIRFERIFLQRETNDFRWLDWICFLFRINWFIFLLIT